MKRIKEMINQVIIDSSTLSAHYLFLDGFIFTSVHGPANVFNGIVVRNPENAECHSPKYGFSDRTFEEHIRFIQENELEKAVVIAEDISFLTRCPSLKHLYIIPANTAPDEFDYSPLYRMPEIQSLTCTTEYGPHEELRGTLNYGRIQGLRYVNANGSGHETINQIPHIEKLWVGRLGKKIDSMEALFTSPDLKDLDCVQCSFQNLKGIERAKKLESLSLQYNRSLSDISTLSGCRHSLRTLAIYACGKIQDFSVLDQLDQLEHLELMGSNTLPNLRFLSNMKKLKTFSFSMNVLDGDLSFCLSVPYVNSEKNRKHYNYKDSELPKELPQNRI